MLWPAAGRHPYPELVYYCTRVFARSHWPDMPSYALELVADRCGIDFGHHDPGEDARASAEIALRIADDLGVDGLQQVAETVGVRPGHMFAGSYEACGRMRSSADGQYRRRWTADDFTPESDHFDEGHPFYRAEVVFTGTLQSIPSSTGDAAGGECGGAGREPGLCSGPTSSLSARRICDGYDTARSSRQR